MAYFTPYIDSTGLHIPTYADILSDLISQMKNIFGSDIYIDSDSMDYQQISIFAKKIYDTYSFALLVYNNRTPVTAIGVGLDNAVSYAGIVRNPATYSTCQVTVTGDPGTVITNGQVSDGTNTWNLPDSVTIPSGGTITVVSTCSVSGNVSALPNTITIITTPVYGWLSVTNNYSANAGTNVETDANLRGRFAVSVMSPSSTVFEALQASILDVDAVTRSKCFENDTSTTSSQGFPPHSVTCVVEGGTDNDVATAIYYEKTPGCYTNGTTSVELTSEAGNVTTIRFYRPTYKTIYLKVFITSLNGYNSSSVTDIQNAIVSYISNLDISESVYRGVIISTAVSQNVNLSSPTFTVTDVQLSTDGTNYSTADISCLFNEVASITASNIQVVVS